MSQFRIQFRIPGQLGSTPHLDRKLLEALLRKATSLQLNWLDGKESACFTHASI